MFSASGLAFGTAFKFFSLFIPWVAIKMLKSSCCSVSPEGKKSTTQLALKYNCHLLKTAIQKPVSQQRFTAVSISITCNQPVIRDVLTIWFIFLRAKLLPKGIYHLFSCSAMLTPEACCSLSTWSLICLNEVCWDLLWVIIMMVCVILQQSEGGSLAWESTVSEQGSGYGLILARAQMHQARPLC